MLFDQGCVRNYPGREEMYALTAPPFDIAQAFVQARQQIYLGRQDGVFKYIAPQMESGGSTAPAGWSQLYASSYPETDWVLVPWGDWIIATNGRTQVQIDKNTGTMGDLAGVPFAYARFIFKFANHLFAVNTDLSGRVVYFSSRDNPELWTPSLSNTAGETPIRDLDGRFVAGAPLGNQYAIYTADKMVVCRFIGGTNVFGFSPPINGLGVEGAHAVIGVNEFNWGMNRRGIWKTDGRQVDYIDDPILRKWLRQNVNFNTPSLIYGWHDESSNRVCWSVPLLSGDRLTVALNYTNASWTFLHPGISVGLEENVFQNILAASDSMLYNYNDTTPEAAWIETKPMSIGTREVRKLFQAVRVDSETSGDVRVQMAFMESLTATPVWEAQDYSILGDADSVINVEGGGRDSPFLKLRFSCPEGGRFRLYGFDLLGEATGYTQ